MAETAPPANVIHPETLADLRDWLSRNHEKEQGTWLVLWKKESGRVRPDYGELVEELLCFGWIDSKPGKLDAHRSMLWIAPRKPGTNWSKLNKERVEAAIAAGRMTVAGLAKVKTAKKDGSWTALDAVEALELPADLVAAFRQHKPAATHFEAFPRSVKRSTLEWIANAKTAETRARRIAETAERAAVNERANQWRQPKAAKAKA